ncbi:RNA-binding region RNP-1 domain-containing protein [Tieghemostelium lacteum]|uniref:RNA-binding region RNP-1 domain-containing protein n=1 Tax=Tieghemostelium lacteum TaxID=361077 RepID=A0A151ZKM6_TIELA|nr:RNA-binding region RNP-1 domain-containing protein [Tieghemostelium lacteum]|eukprot:KYQ94475.1 RNA-binding region RNP-1 domain-containing protein [Tieghemostelium lacteum]
MDIQEQYSQSPHRPSNGGGSGSPRGRSRDRSPRDRGDKDSGEFRNRLANTAEPSNILGIFGLAQKTNDHDLENEFGRFGKIERVDLIMDRKTGQSKCFAFVYFEKQEDAVRAKEECQGIELHGKKIRTDFSATKKAHDPTPGRYFGNPRNDNRNRSPPRYSPYGGGSGRPFRDNERGYRGGGGGGGGGDYRREDRGYRGEDRYRDDRYRDDRYRDDRYRSSSNGGEDRGYRSGSSSSSDYRRGSDLYRSSGNGSDDRYRNGEDRYNRPANDGYRGNDRSDDERRYR